MRLLAVMSPCAALMLAASCGSGASRPTSTPDAQTPATTASPLAAATIDPAELPAHETELRTAFEQFERDLLAGNAAHAYTYASDSLKQKCSLLDFVTLLAIVKGLLGDVADGDLNVNITNVRYDAGKAYVAATSTVGGEDLSSTTSDESMGYWIWENGGWKIDTSEDKPCAGISSGNSGTPTPGPTGPGTSRRDPIPLGSSVRTGDLEATVLNANLDAADEIMAASQFAKPPKPGNHYVLVRVRVQNVGTGEDTLDVSEGDFSMTGSANILYEPYDNKSTCDFVTPDRLDAHLYPGGTAEGNVCFQIPADEQNLLLVASPFPSFKSSDRRYLALQ